MKKAAEKPTIAFTTEIQLRLLEEQAAFDVRWREPLGGSKWSTFIRRIMLYEVALDADVTLDQIIQAWPDFRWETKGTSTLRRWMTSARENFKRLPADSKIHIRSLARWHFKTERSSR